MGKIVTLLGLLVLLIGVCVKLNTCNPTNYDQTIADGTQGILPDPDFDFYWRR